MSSLPLSYNIRNLILRWRVTLLAIGGIALVVAVMLVLVAISNVIAVQRGAQSELNHVVVRGVAPQALLGLAGFVSVVM